MPLPLLGAGAIIAASRALLLGLIASVIAKLPEIVMKVLAGLGLYFFVAKPATSALRQVVVDSFGAVNGTALETLFYLQVDDWALAVLSAHAINMGRKLVLARRAPGA